jgi:hypothetical protein
MKLDITSTKIQFHLTNDDFEASLSESLNLIFLGSSLIGILSCCVYLIVSEWSSNIYGLYIFLLVLSPIIWLGTSFICEGMFPFIGEFLLTVDSEQLSINRKMFIAVLRKRIPIKDITEVGQMYFDGFSPEDAPLVLFQKCFVRTNYKQIFFGACIKQENKDLIIAEINKFIFEQALGVNLN